MEFRLLEVISKGIEHSFHEELDMKELLDERKDVLSASPLHVDLAVRPGDGAAIVSGELKADLKMACSRCLEPAEAKIGISIEERFAHASGAKDEHEDEDLIVVDEDMVDLRPYVEGTFLLYLPISPLCSEDCKGLCPECGTNLNVQSCGCSRERIDPRFEALKKLLE